MRVLCECADKACGVRLPLGDKEYDALAELGAVVSPWCAVREGKHPIARIGEKAVAVSTSPSVRNLVERMRGGTQWVK